MGQFATGTATPRGGVTTRTPPRLGSVPTPDTVTAEGGRGFTRTTESELFILGASYLFGQPTFYEHPSDRDRRFTELVGKADPEWLRGFIPFLRQYLNIRTAAVVAAAEYVAAGHPAPRKIVDGVLQRADEPAEMVGYWLLRHGKRIPKGVKRGVADALIRLGSEYNALKYAGWGNRVAMADAIQLTHPTPKDDAQRYLFQYLLAKRRGVPNPTVDLPMHSARASILEVPEADRRAFLASPSGQDALRNAGATWEWVAGTYLPGGMDAQAWELMAPQMGVMALLRNLRNFDEAGLSDQAAERLAAKLRDPEQVRKSRVLPLRFLQAWEATNTLRWGQALESGLEASLSNVPAFTGHSVVLTDVSGSMTWGNAPWRQAAAFATAVAKRSASADLWAYSTSMERFKPGSILRTTEAIRASHVFGGGTQTVGAVAQAYQWAKGQGSTPARVVVVTDEAAFGSSTTRWQQVASIPCPIYTWNVQGYREGWVPSGSDNRYTVGGLSDAGFRLIEALESGRDGSWPWQ